MDKRRNEREYSRNITAPVSFNVIYSGRIEPEGRPEISAEPGEIFIEMARAGISSDH